jgi:hypothetical protein
MLIWLNGTFGVGKTSLAFEMQALHPNALIFDPEEIGFGLRRAHKPMPNGDFQDIPLWRELVCVSLEHLAKNKTCPIIIPMTLVNPIYFQEIIGELRTRGVDVRHFALIATSQAIKRRLHRRGDGRNQFALQNLQRNVEALQNPIFTKQISTDHVPLETLARDLLQQLDLPIIERIETQIQRAWRRFKTWRQAIRFD